MNLLTRLYWTAYLAYHLRPQARYAFRPLAHIQRDQARRVQQMVAYAYRYVPYYRETMPRLGLTPDDFRTADDLSRLPLLERADLQRDPLYFVSTAQPLSRYLHLRSSGSTGAPVSVYWDAAGIFLTRAAGERSRVIIAQVLGKTAGYREIAIVNPGGSSQCIREFSLAHSLSPPGVALRWQWLSLYDSPADNLARLNEFAPDVVDGYSSYLEMFFAYIEATGAPFQRPKVLTYGFDNLSPSARRMIEQGFGIPTFGIYRANEAFPLGFECEQRQGYHLNMDLYPLRIVDGNGKTLPPGESGDVVISNLVNHGTVLLNYRLGDLATLAPEPCPCGRSLPLLASLDGRSYDWIEIRGQKIHPMALHGILKFEEGIWQYQVVQRTPTEFHIAIVPMETCNREEIRAHIAAKFAECFGPDIRTEITFVRELPRTAGGKVRAVVALRRDPPSQ
ncbi:MAG: phenylacetate--CoA ligase family protein [Chloroflexi bacterium]|nr:phenylacetate--CoA ligase family protein [Chloroflexota bacterium]